MVDSTKIEGYKERISEKAMNARKALYHPDHLILGMGGLARLLKMNFEIYYPLRESHSASFDSDGNIRLKNLVQALAADALSVPEAARSAAEVRLDEFLDVIAACDSRVTSPPAPAAGKSPKKSRLYKMILAECVTEPKSPEPIEAKAEAPRSPSQVPPRPSVEVVQLTVQESAPSKSAPLPSPSPANAATVKKPAPVNYTRPLSLYGEALAKLAAGMPPFDVENSSTIVYHPQDQRFTKGLERLLSAGVVPGIYSPFDAKTGKYLRRTEKTGHTSKVVVDYGGEPVTRFNSLVGGEHSLILNTDPRDTYRPDVWEIPGNEELELRIEVLSAQQKAAGFVSKDAAVSANGKNVPLNNQGLVSAYLAKHMPEDNAARFLASWMRKLPISEKDPETWPDLAAEPAEMFGTLERMATVGAVLRTADNVYSLNMEGIQNALSAETQGKAL